MRIRFVLRTVSEYVWKKIKCNKLVCVDMVLKQTDIGEDKAVSQFARPVLCRPRTADLIQVS